MDVFFKKFGSFQGQWGVTAELEAEEQKRVHEFQETVPKMRSQLRVLTHLYQVPARAAPTSSRGTSAASQHRPPSSRHHPSSLLQSIVQHFLVLLMTSTDESLRFLSFRLDFNEHYRFAFSEQYPTQPTNKPPQGHRNNDITP